MKLIIFYKAKQVFSREVDTALNLYQLKLADEYNTLDYSLSLKPMITKANTNTCLKYTFSREVNKRV